MASLPDLDPFAIFAVISCTIALPLIFILGFKAKKKIDRDRAHRMGSHHRH